MQEREQEAGQVCAACGASNAPEASFCGVCGQGLLGSVETSQENWLPMQSSVHFGAEQFSPSALAGDESAGPASAGMEGAEELSEAPEGQVAQKRCGWCSNLSSWTAAVCEHCGAHFPVPEQDEAFRRAAEERMRQDLESLNFLSQRRRRGWRRFII
jgi:ribosomal protein L40E